MFVLGMSALCWANLPYLIGYLVADQQTLFSGFFIFEQDGFSYLAKMRQGAEGSWLFHLPFTTEPHQGAILYSFYIVLGKAARSLGVSMTAAYHLARLAGTAALLAGGMQFVHRFAATARWRVITWVMVLFGGGLGWIVSMLKPDHVAYASVAPDAFLFSVLFGPPHIIAALALLVWLLLATLRLFERNASGRGWAFALGLGVGGLALALVRPAYVVILLAVLGAYLLALSLRKRRLPIREGMLLVVVAVPAIPYLLYLLAIFQDNPAMAAWKAQNPFGTPRPFNILTDLGPLLAAGLIGVIRGRWWRDERRLFLVAWLAALPIMLYAPLPLQRRLIGGAQFAIAIPAAYWVDQHLLPWLNQIRWRKVVFGPPVALAALALVSYPLMFGLGAAGFVASRPEPLFLTVDETAALQWLAGQEGRPVVLCAEQTGNRIPAYSHAVPVLGHPVETLAVERKRADVARFYAAGTDPAERQAILTQYGVDYIWWGPAEWAVAASGLAPISGLRNAFSQGSAQVWIQAGQEELPVRPASIHD